MGRVSLVVLSVLWALAHCSESGGGRDLSSEIVGVWAFVGQNVDGSRHSECPATIEHTRLAKYRGLVSGAEVWAVRWRHLLVDGAACSTSQGPQTATIVAEDTDRNAKFFASAQDNSPRRCGAFASLRPARYYFTDTVDSLRDWLADNTLLGTANATALEAVFDGAPQDARWMMSQQFIPEAAGAASSRVTCFYRKSTLGPPTPPRAGGSVCFPASATVTTPMGKVPMSKLRIGDSIAVHTDTIGGDKTSRTQWAEVYFFSHRDAQACAEFVRVYAVDIANNAVNAVVLTPSHYLYASDGSARLRLAPAGSLRAGQRIASGVVKCVTQEQYTGLYAPHTTLGEPIVDGVLVSQYTTTVRPAAAHAILAPLRAVWRATRIGCALPPGVHALLDIVSEARKRRPPPPRLPPWVPGTLFQLVTRL